MLVNRLIQVGSGAWLWLADLARAYPQIRVCPLSALLLGITLNTDFYVDIAPPFGCRTSALACARTICASVWLLRKEGFFTMCYLDDFVGLEQTKGRADQAYARLLQLASLLGLVLAHLQ